MCVFDLVKLDFSGEAPVVFSGGIFGAMVRTLHSYINLTFSFHSSFLFSVFSISDFFFWFFHVSEVMQR